VKIAITGHTSGIGEALHDLLSLTGGFTYDKLEVRGFSRSNGWNLAEHNGALLIDELLEWNPDIVFNNAWHPYVQNKICKSLHKAWKDEHKVIVNTGSITGYVPHSVLDDKNIYAHDKKALSEYCIHESFKYPYENKCRLINFSWGFVETGLINSTQVDAEALIDTQEAAMIMIEHAERAYVKKENWSQPEVIINSMFFSSEEQDKTFKTAARGVAKHLIKTRKLSK